LPKLTAVARLLEQLIVANQGSDGEAAEQLGAIKRRIEESKLRFSID
jgi:hypothetical protein